MQGNEVFKIAVNTLGRIVDETLHANDLAKTDIDWLIPHQANIRIIAATARKLKMSMDRVVRDGRRTRQHLGRLGAAGAGYGGTRRPHQARRTADAGGLRRRVHLGFGIGQVLTSVAWVERSETREVRHLT